MSRPATLPNDNTEPRPRSRIWLGLTAVVIVAAVLVALLFLQGNGPSAGAAEAEPVNLAEVVMADLTQEQSFNGKLESVGGTGTVIPASRIELGFASPGTLAELRVQVGQRVQAGDVLARVDNVAAQHAVSTAELQLAQIAVQTKDGVSFDDINLAQAQINLDVAQRALDNLLNWEPDEADIALAEANLAAAQGQLYSAAGSDAAAQNQVEILTIALEQAQQVLASARANYDNAFDSARDWEPGIEQEREAAAASLQWAQDNVAIAQINLDSAQAMASYGNSVSAQSGVLSAKQALTIALTGPTDEQIAVAETAVQQAELDLQQAQLNQQANQLSLAQAKLSLALAQEGLAGTSIIAPIDGTVMSVNGHVGEQVGTAPFITLADLSQPTLEIFVDETNLDKVAVGTQVEAVFSALPTERFTGTVTLVDPQLHPSGDLSVVRALARLDGDHEQTLPVGLNAAVNVVGLSNRIVRVSLPLDDEGLLAVGDPVTVELPDLSQVSGAVVFVPPAPTASAYGPAAFEVLVELSDDPTAAAGLAELPDETPVDVIFVSDSVQDVMAIPVSALVALLEGGYAVEKRTALGQIQLVAVEVGFFGSNNMIAITSHALQPGDQVVVP